MAKKANKEGTMFTLSMKYYQRYLVDFIRYAKKFRVIHDGSSVIIEFENKSWRFMDYGGVAGRGFHLCKFVREDAEKFVKENPDSEYVKKIMDNADLEIQKANPDGLKKHLGSQIYGVDVNDCYWDTAHKMGFISKATHMRGLKQKDWKTGRNASIGALSKVVYASDYVDGIRQDPVIIKGHVDLSPIRDAVVRNVHDMFMGIINKLGDDWLMYFTDCVYVPLERVEEVQAYFEQHGYQTKVSTYQLDSFDEQGNVYWHDYQKNRAKMFRFNERQFNINPIPMFMVNSKLTANDDFLNQK